MNYKNLIVEVKDYYEIITINRPEFLNALNAETMDELETEIDIIAKNPQIRTLILTGSGEKAFVAGADINEVKNLSCAGAEIFSGRGHKLFNKIENLAIPVIAAVNGFALGGGCELALACDIRIASTNAKFGLPEVNLGVIPGYGGTQRLPRLVGKAKAMELTLTGDIINAEEALGIGLVNKVVNPGRLINEAVDLAQKIIQKAPQAVRMAKESINKGLNLSIDEGCLYETGKFALVCATEDKNEGVRAFLEKRKPVFTGK